MTALCGFHHVGVLTDDLDGFLAFYQTTFGARVVRDTTDGGVRNALIDVGGGLLNVFLVEGTDVLHPDRPGFRSGRLNHYALSVPTLDAFLEIRRRLIEADRSEGSVRDFGSAWSLKFHDPDGFESELVWTINSDRPLTSPPRILTEQEALTTAGLEAVREPPDSAFGLESSSEGARVEDR
jgi:catechol 2,3-dioxygenase-like lactoylglutathione lyase family enzyme